MQDERSQRPPGDPADQVLVPDPRQEVGRGEDGGGTPAGTVQGGRTVASVHGDTVPVQIEEGEMPSLQVVTSNH